MKLMQDNGKKIELWINEEPFIDELKKFFRWRKNVAFERYNKLGSKKHDEFIEYLYNKGHRWFVWLEKWLIQSKTGGIGI